MGGVGARGALRRLEPATPPRPRGEALHFISERVGSRLKRRRAFPPRMLRLAGLGEERQVVDRARQVHVPVRIVRGVESCVSALIILKVISSASRLSTSSIGCVGEEHLAHVVARLALEAGRFRRCASCTRCRGAASGTAARRGPPRSRSCSASGTSPASRSQPVCQWTM